ncbi:MAG: M13-type metalloendopeptidase [Woeseiaceae bacterium]
MKLKIVGAAALLMLAACGQESATAVAQDARAALKSGIDMTHIDTSIKPGDDFYGYMNARWVEEFELPADKSNYGTFTMLRDKSQEDVKAIVDMAATGDFARGTDEQKVGDLYKSYLDMDTRNARGIEPLQPELERIAAISSRDELAAYFAGAIKRGYGMPFVLFQVGDMKDPANYGIYTYQAGIGLPDREYYFTEDEKSAAIRADYVAHIEKMFGLAGFGDAAEAAAEIMALETRIAAAHMTKEEARDWMNNYNKVPVAELGSIMPTFAWPTFLDEAGLNELENIIVLQTDYMGELDAIVADTDLDTWKNYLKWNALNSRASVLNKEIDDQDFAFFSTTLRGIEEQEADWRRAVSTVNGTLGEVVGKVYVKNHFPPEAKERMLELVGNLISAYETSIKELDWMGEETRAQALAKLYKFEPKIGYPDEWRDYSALDVEPDDLFGNIERAALAEYQRQLDRQGGPVDRKEWGMTPQTVNASYNPTMNQITFPAAILQPPFFDLAADEAVNYGAIGAVIGHEIGHGFDDKGSTFDGDGALRNWWTDEDRTEFEKRTAALVDQFDSYKVFDDLHVNGEFTLGENIGDLGGLSIALKAYHMSLNGEEPPLIDGYTGEQRVFLGWAQVWRRKYRDEELRRRIAIDPHSPAEFRVNGIVRNVPEFYEAFDVKPGDALYLPPEERVKIW